MSFAQLVIPPAARRWELTGPAGYYLDILLAQIIAGGGGAEALNPGTRYRIDGPAELLTPLCEEVAKVDGFTLAEEYPAPGSLTLAGTIATARSFKRSTAVHGTTAQAFHMVARAVDHRLDVETVGHYRWSVTGPSSTQMQWLADSQGMTLDDVLSQWQTTRAAIAAEDAAQVVPLRLVVSMAAGERKTGDIVRNQAGDIVKMTTIETGGTLNFKTEEDV